MKTHTGSVIRICWNGGPPNQTMVSPHHHVVRRMENGCAIVSGVSVIEGVPAEVPIRSWLRVRVIPFTQRILTKEEAAP